MTVAYPEVQSPTPFENTIDSSLNLFNSNPRTKLIEGNELIYRDWLEKSLWVMGGIDT